MSYSDKHLMFKNRLEKVHRHLNKLAKKKGVSCFRLYDRDLPEFPLIIEKYGNNIYLAEYRSKHQLTEEEYEKWLNDCLPIISEVTGIEIGNIFIKLRKRKSSRSSQYQKIAEEKEFFVVQEDGLFFLVNLSDYLDTGLFLDHRITRKMVRSQSSEKKVLNLFCYTGSFSVFAAAGGASEVISVDLSNTYLSWAEENFKLNKLEGQGKYKFIKADVKQYLDELPNDYFDIVIMDPPTFSNSKMMKDFLDIQRDHVDLLNKVLAATKKGGTVYFSTNSRKFELDSNKLQASTIKDITKATTDFDFQGKLLRWCFQITK